jgi:Secretion system C-terminal sorting domain
VRNRGCAPSLANKNVKLYWAKASTALAWTAPWDGSQFIPASATPMGGSIGAKLTNVISSGGEQILEYQWVVPDPALYSYFGGDATHFCLLARIEETNTYPYGMTSPEGFYLSPNVQANNNIAWKNITILTSNSPSAGVVVGNPWKVAMNADFNIKFSTPNFLSFLDVFLELNATMYDKLKKGGFKMEGAKLSNNTLQFTAQNAVLYNVALNAGEFSWLKFKISPKTTTAFAEKGLFFDVNQIASATGINKQTLGGERFIISNTAAALGGTQSSSRESSTEISYNETVAKGITLSAFPNPTYDGRTTIAYSLDRSDNVSLQVFNAIGQPVQTLLSNATLSSGNYSAEFNGDNLPSGIYYYVLQVGNEKISQKLSLIK